MLFLTYFLLSYSKVPAFLNVTDIAGLVKGASDGEGLGNAFLSHIKACDAIFHMTRKYRHRIVIYIYIYMYIFISAGTRHKNELERSPNLGTKTRVHIKFSGCIDKIFMRMI